MFRKPKCENTRKMVRCSRDMKLSAFRAPSMIDSFMFQKHKSVADGVDSIRVTSDIYMLFNQQRLDRMTREALINHFDNMQVQSPALKTLRSKLSDDQLISLVKSRYIQQPSELLQWSMYLNSLADEQIQTIAAQLQQQRADVSSDSSTVSSSSGSASAE